MRTGSVKIKIIYFVLCMFFVVQLKLVFISTSQETEAILNEGVLIDQNMVDYLIISRNQFLDELQPLVNWKWQRGLYVNIETIEELSLVVEGNNLPEKIRRCIKNYYLNNGTTWVLLAGGAELIPTKCIVVDGVTVSCDNYYSNLDDDWLSGDSEVQSIDSGTEWEPEVYVGRLPADNEDQMRNLVQRIVDYEKNPPVGTWMNTAVFGGTFANFNSDLNDNDELDDSDWKEFDTNRNHNWLKANVVPSHWDSVLLGETEGVKKTDYDYDLSISEENLVRSINSGAGMVQADAHGSPTGMYRSIFITDADGDKLFDHGEDTLESEIFLSTSTEFETNGKNGLYFLAACATGTFNGTTCLTEYIVRNCGIGCIGSSMSSYYDNDEYTDSYKCWVTQGLLYRFWLHIFTENSNHPGMALALAKDAYAKDCQINLRSENSDLRTLTQYNLMGDPEVPIWTKIPTNLESYKINNTDQIVVISDNNPIEDACVTLINSTYFWRSMTNSDGKISLPSDLGNFDELNITVSKSNFLPLQTSLGSIQLNTRPSEVTSFSFWILGIIFLVTFSVRKQRR